jgi:hypothetical protein
MFRLSQHVSLAKALRFDDYVKGQIALEKCLLRSMALKGVDSNKQALFHRACLVNSVVLSPSAVVVYSTFVALQESTPGIEITYFEES